MRLTVIILSLLFSAICSAQKTYKIGKVLWTYQKPVEYKTRIDNFASTIKTGDSIIKKNNNLENQSDGDIILFSLAKHDSINLNIVVGSYKSSDDIEKFTLSGYVEKIMEFMQSNFEQLKSDAQITKHELMIDKVKFFIVESKMYHKKKNFTYWTRMYIAELGGKEFNITVAYDNEKDKIAIEKSIVNSKFVTL